MRDIVRFIFIAVVALFVARTTAQTEASIQSSVFTVSGVNGTMVPSLWVTAGFFGFALLLSGVRVRRPRWHHDDGTGSFVQHFL